MNTSEKQVGLGIAQAKEQMEEFARPHATGELPSESYEQARLQVERGILNHVLADQAPAISSWRQPGRHGWLAFGGLLLALAVGTLAWVAYRANSSTNDSAAGPKSYRLSGSGSAILGADPHAAILQQMTQTPEAIAPKGAGSPAEVVGSVGTVSGTVVLAPALLREAKPDDTIFVFARSAQGSRMPLAMLRKEVRDLPIQFVLDDSTAMSPQTRLSQAGQVIVVARVTKAANAAPLKGDLMGRVGPVSVGSKGLTIQISEIVSE